jgi:hypothetical protein
MATNARDDTVGALPGELLLDIFARLRDHVDLLRYATTCRRWLRVVAADDASFLRRAGVLPEDKNASLLLGAFYQTKDPVIAGPTTMETSERKSDCPPKFWRIHGLSPADDVDLPGSGHLTILSNHDGLFNYAKPLASRGGLSSRASCPSRSTIGSFTWRCATLSSVACTMFRRLPLSGTPRS